MKDTDESNGYTPEQVKVLNLCKFADEAFEKYKFRDGCVVGQDQSWDVSDMGDLNKTCYVMYPDCEEGESVKMSFHVKFNVEGDVVEAYALDTRSGNEVGSSGDAPV